jgi:hypothetical protein
MFGRSRKPLAAAAPAGPPVVAPPQPLDRPPVIRLVAVELDGTLLNDSKQVSQQTAAALACLPSRGAKLVIASARPPRSVRHIYQGLGLATLQINYNGALIWDEPAARVVFHRPLDAALVRQIIDVARDHFEEVLVTCEVLDKWYTDRFDDTMATETSQLFRPDVIAPIDQFCTQPITKLLLLGPPHMLARLEPLLYQAFANRCTLLHMDQHLIQIMHPAVSKAAALRLVARHYGVPMQQVMAIGDAPNDVGMLQASAVGIAMDNAADIVKQAADWIAPSNNDHGVHAALKRYGLCD